LQNVGWLVVAGLHGGGGAVCGRFVFGRRDGGGGGFREVEDDLGHGGVALDFVLDGREGAQLEARDVGEDGGAARGDFVLGEENVEAGEGAIDAGGGVEVTWIGLAEDGVGAVAVVALMLEEVMRSAEAGTRILARVTAATSGRREVLAAGGGFGVGG